MIVRRRATRRGVLRAKEGWQSVRGLGPCSFAAGLGHARWHGLQCARLLLPQVQKYLVREAGPLGDDVVVVGVGMQGLYVYPCK